MKKAFLVFCLLVNSFCFASAKLHVEALEDFNSISPNKNFKVRLVEDSRIDDTIMVRNDILDCELKEIKDPTRAKQNAKIFYILKSYKDRLGVHNFNDIYVAKYSKTTLAENKSQIAKKTATTVGGFFVKGLSYGVSFVEGVKNNEEDNRLVSGVKKVYDDSFLSLVECGEEIIIKKGDMFYLIVKKYDPKSS